MLVMLIRAVVVDVADTETVAGIDSLYLTLVEQAEFCLIFGAHLFKVTPYKQKG